MQPIAVDDSGCLYVTRLYVAKMAEGVKVLFGVKTIGAQRTLY